MTQLVPDVAVVALLDRGAHEVGVEIFRLETAVRTPHVADHAAVGANFVLAAEVREHLERADVADRPLHSGDTLLSRERRVEARLQRGRSHLANHAQHLVAVVDDRRMVLQRQRHTAVVGPLGALDQAVAAATPYLLGRVFLVCVGPHSPGDVVAAAIRRKRHARPRGEHSERGRAVVSGHPNLLPHVGELTLAVFRNRAAEVVVRRDSVDRCPRVVCPLPDLEAARPRQVERVAVRPLAVDLDAGVAVLARALDDLLERQPLAAIPDAEKRDAVEADLHWISRARTLRNFTYPLKPPDSPAGGHWKLIGPASFHFT